MPSQAMRLIPHAIFKGLVSQRQRKAGSMKPKLIEGEKQGEGHPQIVGILKEAESGIAMADLIRTHGNSGATFYP